MGIDASEISEILKSEIEGLTNSRATPMGNSSQRVFNRMIDAGYKAYLIAADINPIHVLSLQGNDNYLFVPN